MRRAIPLSLGVTLMTLAVLAAPPVLSRLATQDGSIDGPRAVGAAWLACFVLTLLAAAAFFVARDPSRCRSWLTRLLSWRGRILAGVALCGALSFLGLAAYARARNHVDLLTRLDPGNPISAQVREIADTRGRTAALGLIADHFSRRPPPPAILPAQLWCVGPEESRRRARSILDGDLGSGSGTSPYRWRPGGLLPWRGAVPPSIQFALQRQTFLFDLLRYDAAPPDPAALEVATSFVQEWRRANRVWPNFNPFAWNDDAMANRIQAHMLLARLRRAQGAVQPAEELAFLESLVLHADQLMDTTRHNFRTNHGMMQNCSLLSIAVEYPEFDTGRRWLRTARERMERHFHEAVSPEGAFLELAPGYHWLGTVQGLWFETLARKAGIDLDPSLEETVRRMLNFGLEILNPDGSLPIIADTEGEEALHCALNWSRADLPDLPELERMKRAFSASGAPVNRPGARLWRGAGYFVLRAPAPEWSLDSALMVTLKAGPRSRAHEHYDALSMTLFGHGRPLLTGPGYPSYDDPELRGRLVSTPSQNTVSVDGRSQASGGVTVLFEDIRPAGGDKGGVPEFAAILAESDLYRGVVHRRAVIYGPATTRVLVIDDLISSDEHTYGLHYRMARGLSGRVGEGSLAVFDPRRPEAGPLLHIETAAEAAGSIARPTCVLQDDVGSFSVRGSRVTYASLLDIGRGGSLTPSSLMAGHSLIWEGDRGTLTLERPLISPSSYTWRPARVRRDSLPGRPHAAGGRRPAS